MNFLVVRTDRVGDVVLTLPLAAELKAAYPGCTVTFLVRSYTSELCSGNTNIDQTLVLRESNGKPLINENAAMLRKHNFSAAVAVSPNLAVARILFSAGIPIRIGTAYRWYSFLFNRKVREHRKTGERHEVEFNLNMLVLGGLTTRYSLPPTWGLSASAAGATTVNQLLTSLGLANEKFIVIHPGSGGSAVDLPFASMKALVELLSQRYPGRVLLTGSKMEHPLCSTLASGTVAVNLAGKFTLDELTALLSKASVLCANSTGPIHIAAAVGISVIGFYPKIHQCSPRRWGPYTPKAHIFSPDIGCSGCTRKQCEQLNCMGSINPLSVSDTVSAIL